MAACGLLAVDLTGPGDNVDNPQQETHLTLAVGVAGACSDRGCGKSVSSAKALVTVVVTEVERRSNGKGSTGARRRWSACQQVLLSRQMHRSRGKTAMFARVVGGRDSLWKCPSSWRSSQ